MTIPVVEYTEEEGPKAPEESPALAVPQQSQGPSPSWHWQKHQAGQEIQLQQDPWFGWPLAEPQHPFWTTAPNNSGKKTITAKWNFGSNLRQPRVRFSLKIRVIKTCNSLEQRQVSVAEVRLHFCLLSAYF